MLVCIASHIYALVIELGRSLDRAGWYFEQAGNSDLATKTQAHRLSIQFRLDLIPVYEQKHGNDQTVAVMKGAQLMEALVQEGRLLEVLSIHTEEESWKGVSFPRFDWK